MATAVGSIAAVVIGLGFGSVGPARLAGQDESAVNSSFWKVQYARILAFAAISPPAGLIASQLVPPEQGYLAFAMVIATSASGLSLGWIAVGIGRPSILAIYDAGPKLVAGALSLIVVITTGQVIFYPFVLLLLTVAGLGLFMMKMRRGRERPGALRRAWAFVDWRACASDIAAAAYVSAPLIIAGLVLETAQVSQLGSIDKLYRYALYAVVAVSSSTLSWVLEPGRSARARLVLRLVFFGIAIVGSAVITIAGEPLTRLVFGSAVASPWQVCLGYGAAYLFVASSTPYVQHDIIPANRTGQLLTTTAAAAVIGVAAMAAMGVMLGPSGVSLGFAASEGVAFLLAVVMVKRGRRANQTRTGGDSVG